MKGETQRGSVLLAVVLALSLIGAVALLLNRGGSMNLQFSASQETADVARAAAEAALNHAVWQAQQSNCVNYVNFTDQPFGSPAYQTVFSPVYTTSITPLFGSPVLVKAKGVLQKSGTTRELSRRVRVYEPSTNVTLQLGTDPGKDAMLDDFYPLRNYGGADYLQITDTGSWLQRPVLQFDLTGIPASVKVISAKLELKHLSTQTPGTASIHRLTRDWVEGTKAGGGQADGANWPSHDGTNSWTTAGGDFEATPVLTKQVTSATHNLWVDWEIDTLVADWVSGKTPNYGLLIKSDGSLDKAKFASREATDPADAPKLTITYSCECGFMASNTLVLQPGAEGTDSYVQKRSNDTNKGNFPDLFVDTTYDVTNSHLSLLGFDVSGIPAGAVVNSAQLSLYAYDVDAGIGGADITLHRVLEPWTEDGVTYNFSDGTTPWAWPANFEPVPESNFTCYKDNLGWHTWDMTDLVIKWITGVYPNNGLVLHGTSLVYWSAFHSSDYPDPALHPKLTISYNCPCGVDCSGVGGPTPIAHWKLDETSGLTAMDSAGGHDGTLLMDQTWGTGQIDGGLSFDGFDDYISVPHAETLSLIGEMTFAAWINTLDTSGGYRCILAKDVSGNGMSNYWFGIENDELVFGFWAAGSFQTVSTPSSNLQADRWYHLAATFDDATDEVRLYVDGAEAHVGAIAFAPTTETADVWIGHSADGEYWTGSLDDIRIYNTVLSSGEILALAKETGGPQTLTLAAGVDTWIEQATDVNYGADDWNQTGQDVGENLRRSMIKFDVSSIPAGATVVSATLRLYVVNKLGQNDSNIGMYLIVTDWEENIVTWTSSGGGGYDPTSLAEPLVEWTIGWKEWDVPVGLIHEWIDAVTPNHGLLLDFLSTKKNHVLRFVTREYADTSLHPQLVIEYTEP